MVVPVPTTISTTPEVPATTHCPLTCFTSSMCTPLNLGLGKTMSTFFEKDSKVELSSKGNGGTTMRTPVWKPLRVRHLGSKPLASSQNSSLMGVNKPSCWMLMVGYPKREVNSSG